MQRDKKKLRELKRVVKKTGNRHRRRHLQRELDANPEQAHEAEYEFKQDSSTVYNGCDNKKRKDTDNKGTVRGIEEEIRVSDIQTNESTRNSEDNRRDDAEGATDTESV
jgi:hypothetical protein